MHIARIHNVTDIITMNVLSVFIFNLVLLWSTVRTDGTVENWRQDTSEAVSYTHLDVYKRQV